MIAASLATLSRDLGINLKTVMKWRKRQTVKDLEPGPKRRKSGCESAPSSSRKLTTTSATRATSGSSDLAERECKKLRFYFLPL
jgi:hypothetical protein